ncbi:SgcJ/EcaC family oxidoreductase [Streptomyces sp. NPDC052000]|uniref:YybH family protein n=1 Tax=Streptomyces sp. NPDC052000 TaxID=3155676 RepID=UPI00344E7645
MNSNTTETVAGVMARLTDAWQAKDVPGYLALLTDHVDVVNRGGQRLTGKQAFAQQLNWLLDYPAIFEAEHTLESVRVLRPGMALAHELRIEPLRQSRATYLLVEHEEGQWLIESIAIAPIERPRDPATGERI